MTYTYYNISGVDVLEDVIGYMRRENLNSLKAATQIMITPLGFRFRIVSRIITNFHQPKSTLLLLISAYVGEDWRKMYQFALDNGFRFLSYGDSSLLICDKE
ncbi:MAG: S-adenosylmethionine:tRNA ribosyltransferase-isomerase [Alistipes sp.]|nr:S-adenosylmethionine:tRNA ribosyltransferase-isomerase [Alistipes sp.]